MKHKFCLGSQLGRIAVGIVFLISCNQSKTTLPADQQSNGLDNSFVENHRWKPLPDSVANFNLANYRKPAALTNLAQDVNGKTYGVVHEPESALAYDTGFFPNFVKSHQKVKPGYKWSVGLYPQIVKDTMLDGSQHNRLAILMIPTMRDTDIVNHPKNIIDYFSTINSPDHMYYVPDSLKNASDEKIKEILGGSGGGNSYDQGTVFP